MPRIAFPGSYSSSSSSSPTCALRSLFSLLLLLFLLLVECEMKSVLFPSENKTNVSTHAYLVLAKLCLYTVTYPLTHPPTEHPGADGPSADGTYLTLLFMIIYCPQVVEDWKFVSMVLDRFFLWVFTLSCIGGTLGIIFQSPSLYDTRPAIDQQLSEIPLKKANFMARPEILRVNFD